MGQPLDVLWRHSQHFHGPIHHSRVKGTSTQEMWNLISETLDLVLGWDIYHGLNQRQKDSRFLSWYKCECRFTQGETQGIGVPHCQHFVKFKNHTQVTDTMLWKELCVLQPCAQITATPIIRSNVVSPIFRSNVVVTLLFNIMMEFFSPH